MKIAEADKNKWIYAIVENVPNPVIIRVIEIVNDIIFINSLATPEDQEIWTLQSFRKLDWDYLPEIK